MRRRVLLFGLISSITWSSACLDEDLTLGEACLEDDECLGNQICGRTAAEISFGLPGLCVKEGGSCDFGNQIGCVCDAGGTPDIEDDTCIQKPPRYQTNAQIFITCDKTEGSVTYGQCIIDDGAGN